MADKEDTEFFMLMDCNGEEEEKEELEEGVDGDEERGRDFISSSSFASTHWPRSYKYRFLSLSLSLTLICLGCIEN